MTSSAQKHRRLSRLFDQQDGVCCYCDGPTWLPRREKKTQARTRLGIPAGLPGWGKMLTAARATQEHVVRKADGGKNQDNLKMACHACNVRRGNATPEQHRENMQALVRAGVHPTNRAAPVEQALPFLKTGLKALKRLRAGKPITPAAPTEGGGEHV